LFRNESLIFPAIASIVSRLDHQEVVACSNIKCRTRRTNQIDTDIIDGKTTGIIERVINFFSQCFISGSELVRLMLEFPAVPICHLV